MDDVFNFDPGLLAGSLSGVLRLASGHASPGLLSPEVAPEVKSAADDGEAGREALIDAMIAELGQQFSAFRAIRSEAEAEIARGEGDLKIAKADLKAAADALSLIVRTLEKLDALRRSFAEERAARQEEAFDDDAYRLALARIDAHIEARARERADALFASMLEESRAEGRHVQGRAGAGPPESENEAAWATG